MYPYQMMMIHSTSKEFQSFHLIKLRICFSEKRKHFRFLSWANFHSRTSSSWIQSAVGEWFFLVVHSWKFVEIRWNFLQDKVRKFKYNIWKTFFINNQAHYVLDKNQFPERQISVFRNDFRGSCLHCIFF